MLSITDLSCTRGDKQLFSGVSFSLQAGEWVHLEGANGVGKTSLLRIVAGLTQPSAGKINWNGQSIHADADAFREDLLYIGHVLALKDDMSALENLQADAAIAGRHLDQGKALAALTGLGLKGRSRLPVRVLSQGQKRRAALARLMTSPAKLWVLDEPFVALDVQAQQLIHDVISNHVQQGGIALLTSHQAVTLSGQGRTYRLNA
jgi:heme exporter protein A